MTISPVMIHRAPLFEKPDWRSGSNLRFGGAEKTEAVLDYFATVFNLPPDDPRLPSRIDEKLTLTSADQLMVDLDRLARWRQTALKDPQKWEPDQWNTEFDFYEDELISRLKKISEMRASSALSRRENLIFGLRLRENLFKFADILQKLESYVAPARVWRFFLQALVRAEELACDAN